MMEGYKQYDEKFSDYSLSVLSGEKVACEYIRLAAKRYLSFFDEPDMEFRPEKVERVVTFISKLKHFTGAHAGKPFVLSDWQFWIVCNIFGFYWKESGLRVTKNVYLEVARKQGKSAFAAALCLYAMIGDNEPNAEIELVANSRKQAGISFDMCHNFCSSIDPKGKYFKRYRDKIKFDKTKSLLQVLSSDAGGNDGYNAHTFLCDEVHEYKDSKLYDVLKSSQGMRSQPLAIIITSAGFNLYGFCYNVRKTNIEILFGKKEDKTQFSAIYTLDEGDDWKDEKVWIKSNPNLGITVREQYLREQVQQATNNVSLEVGIKTKNFNVWCQSSSVWINNNYLLRYSRKLDHTDYNGNFCYMGIDLSAVSDLTAVSAMIPLVDGDKFYFKTWYFLPESALMENSNAEVYKDWKRKGLLEITSGNVVDYDYIVNKIMEINNELVVQKIAYDSWNATQFAINATSLGLPLEPFSQSLGSFNRPTKEFERLLKSGKIVIDDNEITRWCFGNVVLKTDYNENCKPIKTEAQQKIDGVISMLEALGIFLLEPHYSNTIMAI